MRVMLDTGAKLPTKAHDWDAGWDLYATKDFEVPACKYDATYDMTEVGSAIHDTGVHMAIPAGYVGFLKSKSGLNVKHGLTSDGVIDAGYTGSIVVKLYNHSNEPYRFSKGDKITQLVILPIFSDTLDITDNFDTTDRGNSGFGSSGK